MKEIAQVVENLSSDFSRLEQACNHPKDSGNFNGLFLKMEHLMESSLDAKSPRAVKEMFEDLRLRVTTWREVWPRLGKDPQFRNAVARESHAWSQKLLRLKVAS